MTGSTEKRLLKYAWLFKRTIIIAIVCLMIATAMELAGPLIAKKVIDDHILGIEGIWYEVDKRDETASYEGKYFMRDERAEEAGVTGDAWTLLAIGKKYYITDEEVPLQGKRNFEAGKLTIGTDEQVQVDATELSLKEVYQFFSLEKKAIFLLLGLYVFLLFAAGIFQFTQTYLLQKSSNNIVRKMRNDIFKHTQTIPMQYYVNEPAGKIVARITNDTEAMRELYERVLSIVVTQIIYMLGILGAIYILHPPTAIVCLLMIPLIYVWMRVYKFFGSRFNYVIRLKNSEINGNINESIQGMSIIQAFQIEKKVMEDFNQLNEDIYGQQKKLVKLNALTNYNLVNVFRNLTFVGLVWYFGNFSLEPNSVISIGMLYALVDYLTRFYEPVNNLVNQFPLIEQARAAGDRMFALMDEEGETVNIKPVERYEGNITFDNVTFSYDGKEDVLKNISFKVQAGETVAFVGHTGSGKSSTMNLLTRFYDPQKGNIYIDHHNIQDLSRQQVRSHMGIVLQDPFIFSGTIISNVTMNNPHISREQAIKALKAVGADSFIEKLPHQYDEAVSEGGSSFSLGQRQLLSFARALAFDPAILILDEATANIDTETEAVIQKALNVLKEGRTTLVIAHRLSTIKDAHHIFVLEHGKIIERGNHESLIAEKGIYFNMYQMQKGKDKVS